jgi:hypothetical protein
LALVDILFLDVGACGYNTKIIGHYDEASHNLYPTPSAQTQTQKAGIEI